MHQWNKPSLVQIMACRHYGNISMCWKWLERTWHQCSNPAITPRHETCFINHVASQSRKLHFKYYVSNLVQERCVCLNVYRFCKSKPVIYVFLGYVCAVCLSIYSMDISYSKKVHTILIVHGIPSNITVTTFPGFVNWVGLLYKQRSSLWSQKSKYHKVHAECIVR